MTHPEYRQASGICIASNTLSTDSVNPRYETERILEAGGIHVDVMDNHLVPSSTIGLFVVKCLRKVTDRLLDIHLMIGDSDRQVPTYAEAGAEPVTFHVEVAHASIWLVRELWAHGARASMALKLAAPIEFYAEMFDELGMVLPMTVESGLGGQEFPDFMLPKARRARELIGDRPIWPQVDSGISVETIGRCVEVGADILVAGPVVYNAPDSGAVVREPRELADSAWCC